MLSATYIFLFVILSGPPGDRPKVTVLFKTTSQANCEAQAADWNKAAAAHKLTAMCLKHAQKSLVAASAAYDDED